MVLDAATPAAGVTDFLSVDLSDSVAAERATAEAIERHGEPYGVVTAVGVGPPRTCFS
jgi:hypothetical protein